MIIKKISPPLLPVYTLSAAMQTGIKRLLFNSPFGKVFIVSDTSMLLGYYSVENYKETGSLDMQQDPVYLEEYEIGNGQFDTNIPISVDGTDFGVLPIVSGNGILTGAVICTDEAWYSDKIACLKKLEYLSEKNLSLEYWFKANNYKKVAFCGLDELSAAFANEIRHYPSIEVLGIYEQKRFKAYKEKEFDSTNYDTEVNGVDSLEEVFESDADLVIITDWTMRYLEDSPLLPNLRADVIYAPKILDMNTVKELFDSQLDKRLLRNDNIRYINTEVFNRFKAKYQELGCTVLSVAVPNNDDLNIYKNFIMSTENIEDWLAVQNGWEIRGKEVKEYMYGRFSITNIKKDGKIFCGDLKSRYINYVNKTRVVLNALTEYKKTIYLIGPCIVVSSYCTDEQALGYYLQENLINQGLEYKVATVTVPNVADRYYHMKILEDYDVSEGDMIFYLDSKIMQLEWDLDLTPTFKELYKKYGKGFYLDLPIHCGKEGMKAIADFLTDHIDAPLVSDTNVIQLTPPDLPIITEDNPQLKKYQEFIQSNAIHKLPKIGSIVMNCNPFTLGHRYLIEYAAQQVDYLYIFVVEEDKSLFKFEDRIELVKAGTAHLENVKVLPSGQFIISSRTFTEYFEKEKLEGAKIDTSLDVETFGSQIAPCLDITVRFVGEEPLDPVTAQYNQSMKEILPKYGVELHEIPRKEIDCEVISASRVRKLLEEKNWDGIKKLVPETTYAFLEENFR